MYRNIVSTLHAAAVEVFGFKRKSLSKKIWWNEGMEGLVKERKEAYRNKFIVAMDSIKPVFVLLEDLRYLLREIMQTSGQFGLLSCEHQMMICWNIVRLHALK